MTTMRIKQYFAAGAAMVALTAGAPVLMAEDQPQRRQGPGLEGPRGPGGPGMRGPGGPAWHGPDFRSLDLSDDQKAQLKKIRDARQAEFKAAREKIGAARQGMRQLLEAETIDEAAIRARSQEVAAAEAELGILSAKLRRESMQILTAEQLAKLKERRDARGQRQRRPQAQ
jgi:periplasmic protein CpxP/Spy